MFGWFSRRIPGELVLETGAIKREIDKHTAREGHLLKRMAQIDAELKEVTAHLTGQSAAHQVELDLVNKRKKALETLVGAL